MAQKDVKIRVAKIGDLQQDDLNANKGSERGTGMLEESLQRHGFGRSLLLDKNGRIIAGNKTQQAAGTIGLEDVIILHSDGKKVIAVQRDDLDLDDPETRLLALQDNRVAEVNLTWDAAVIAELDDMGVDLSGLWSPKELDALMATLEAGAKVAPGEGGDEFVPPEPAADCPVKPGDLWIIGGVHRMICGDSTDHEVIRRIMRDERAQLLHADPPYGMGKESEGIANDNLYNAKLDAFQMAWFNACRPFVTDNGSAYVWGQAEDLWRLWYVGGLRDVERITMRNEVVWFKDSARGQRAEVLRQFPPATERCLFFMLGEQGFNINADNYWEGWEPIRAYLHGEAQKMEWGPKDIQRICGVYMYSHWFTKSQWTFIPEHHYRKLQEAAEGRAFLRPYGTISGEAGKAGEGYNALKQEFYGTRAFFDNTHEAMTDVWQYPPVLGEERWGHATPKPVAMLERILRSSCPADGLVLDPFFGSGPSLIAGHRTRRRVYGVELHAPYCAIVLARAEAEGLTCQLAERAIDDDGD